MTAGTDIVHGRNLTDADLTSITDYASAALLLDTLGIPAEDAADYGTGFSVIDKSKLLGVPLLILQWRFNEGDYDGDFVSVEAVTKHGDKVVFNDGSSGIRAQLQTVTVQRIAKGHPAPQAGLRVVGGLTKTDYFFNADTKESRNKVPAGEKGWAPASTYYLAS